MPEQQDPTTPPAPPVTEPPAPTPPAPDPKVDELPEWARQALQKANNEAAGYRTKLRDAEAKLANAKSVEEFEAARTELTEANKKLERELLVERVGRNLPDDLRALLRGDTEAELKAHAEVLAKYVNAAPPNLGGGLDPNDQGDDGLDPKEIAKKWRSGRLR